MELGREDGAGGVAHTLVGAVVEVDKVLLPLAAERAGVDGVTVVLTGNVALTSGQVEGGNVVGTVAVLHLDGAGAGGQGEQLVTHADTHDGNLRGLHEGAEVVDGLLAVSGVTGTVGDKDTVVVVGNLLDLEVVGEDGHTGATADQAAEDVLLDTAVDQGDVVLGVVGLDHKGSLRADLLDQVDLAGVDEALVLVGIVLLTGSNSGQRRTLLSEVGDNGTGVDARDGGNTLASAPLAQTLDGSPVAVLLSDIGNDDSGALNVGRLKVLEQVPLVTLVRGNTVVANQRLGEDENLATVRGVGHGLGVSNEGCGKDGLTRDVGVGTKGGSAEDGTILKISVSRLSSTPDHVQVYSLGW